MQKIIFFWVERYLFYPDTLQKLISFILLPLTALYCLFVYTKKIISKPKDFHIPIISIGNLIVGGSGKTPITIELAKKFDHSTIILRGYKRESKGMLIVSKNGEILTTIQKSGDEAMLLAKSLQNSSVIVSEDRKIAIKKAKSIGSKIIFLDDGFSKFYIKKFDILIKPKEDYPKLCLPSGGYRFPYNFYKYANLILEEEKDFKRVVNILNPTKNMIFLTAISKPQRLEKYLPKNIKKIYLPDHSNFPKDLIENIIKNYNPTSILTTTKDAVKLTKYNIPLSILNLNIVFKIDIFEKIKDYIDEKKGSNS